jgi:hypothetical protein
MFSTIAEAWNRDPVREMTDKINSGVFTKPSVQSEVFNHKNQGNAVNESRVPKPSPKINPFRAKHYSDLSLSNISEVSSESPCLSNGLSLLSTGTDSDFGKYAPVSFMKSKPKNDNWIANSFGDSRCDYSIKHLDKCEKCYGNLKKLINRKVRSKMDNIILDMKMKQLESSQISHFIPSLMNPHYNPAQLSTPVKNDSWKNTFIIVIGTIVALFIIFLLVKCMLK